MKKRFYLLLSACFLFCQSYSSHIAGMEINYISTGNGVFDVYVHVYRECSGNTPAAQQLIARCSSYTLTVPTSAQTKVLVRSVNSCGTGCSGGGTIEEHVWKMTLDLSSYNCCEWGLSYEMIHSRHNGQIFFVHASLNKCVNPAPSFTFDEAPPFSATLYQDVALKTSVSPLSGIDSVSYELTEAWQSLGQSITYTSNFSYYRPLTFFGFPNQNLNWPAGFRLDQDGYLIFRPVLTNQVSTIAVKTKFWSVVNGTMQVVGYTVRDFEVTSTPGFNNAPFLSGFKSYPSINEIYLCAGDSSPVWLYATDANGDSMFVTNLTSDSGVHMLLDSLWPGQGKIGLKAYPSSSDTNGDFNKELSFEILDKDCPSSGTKRYIFRLRSARRPQLESALSVTCDSVHAHLNALDSVNSAFFARMSFFNGKNEQLYSLPLSDYSTRLQPGNYKLRAEYGFANGCYNFIDSTFDVLPAFKFSVTGPPKLCDGDTARIVVSDLGSTGSFSFQWQSQTAAFMDSDMVFKTWADASEQLSVRVDDGNGCSYSYGFPLNVINAPAYTKPMNLGFCEDAVFAFGPSITSSLDSFQWFDGVKTLTRGPGPEMWYPFSMFTEGCEYTDSLYLDIWSAPKIQSPVNDTVVCTGESVEVVTNGGQGPFVYYWNAANSNNPRTMTQTGSYLIAAWDRNLCHDTQTIFVRVPQAPGLSFDPPNGGKYLCYYDSFEVEALNVPGGSLLQWPDGKVGDSAFLKPGLHDLMLTDADGCSFEYVYHIQEAPIPDASFYYDIQPETVRFYPIMVGQHLWDFGDGNSSVLPNPEHDYKGPGVFTIIHYFSDAQYACRDTSTGAVTLVTLTGTPEQEMGVFPNPFVSSFKIGVLGEVNRMFLSDARGRTYKLNWIQQGESVTVWGLETLPSGVYFLQVDNHSPLAVIKR